MTSHSVGDFIFRLKSGRFDQTKAVGWTDSFALRLFERRVSNCARNDFIVDLYKHDVHVYVNENQQRLMGTCGLRWAQPTKTCILLIKSISLYANEHILKYQHCF